MMKPDKYAGLMNHLGHDSDSLRCSMQGSAGSPFKLPLETKLITEQILRCKYTGKLKQMYLEAKVLEMITVCLHEMEIVKSGHSFATAWSRSDLESLQRAKAILDNNIAVPPTLSLLAQSVHMDEHKLKRGFKQLFGMPVYAYVLDRRMTKAKYLLEMEQLRVGEVAERIGYSSSQHFTRAFYKKFGCNPSDCLKRRDAADL